jgi:hypothetical protein
MQTCIDACNEAASACDHCAASCLQEQDVKALTRCISLDIDCAVICRTAASFMSRGSELAAEVCAACARICDACAEECEQHEMDHCRQCAAACRKCAAECRRMSSSQRASAGIRTSVGASMRQ